MAETRKGLSYADVPKSHRGQLLWRYFMTMKTREPEQCRALENACKRSVLLYFNTYVWLDEPRSYPNCVPFNTYGFQDQYINTLVKNIRTSGNNEFEDKIYDVGVDKSRTMGITWCALGTFDWFWRFFPNSQFLLISKKETDVDKSGSMKALMPKLDYIEERMPNAMQVRGRNHNQNHGRSKLLVYNLKNRSSITVESSNPNAGRSGRYLSVLRDEEGFAEYGESITAACTETTNVQNRVSTANGIANSFYKAKKAGLIDWFTFHWSIHPEYRKGLYEYKNGKTRIIDQEWHQRYRNAKKHKYPFVMGPTHADPGVAWEFLRSPWFDRRCERYANDPYKIAQELQISHHGTGSPYFQAKTIAELRRKHGRPPNWQGSINELVGKDFNDSDVRQNRAKCWFDPIGHRPPQKTSYTFGIDISTGTGASDSAISVIDDASREKVFQFITNGVLPERFAMLTHALSNWFTTPAGAPFIAWDQGGPGLPYGAKMIEIGGMNIFYYKPKDRKDARYEKRPGLPAGGANGGVKALVFDQFRSALFGGWHITHSVDCFDQCLEYTYPDTLRGAPTHIASKESQDVSGRGEQHGDIVVSEVIAFVAASDRPMPQPIKPEFPVNSFGWRREQRRKAQRERSGAQVGDW